MNPKSTSTSLVGDLKLFHGGLMLFGLTPPYSAERPAEVGGYRGNTDRRVLWPQSWKDFFWVQAAPRFPAKPLVPCSINTEQHWGTLASPPMLGEPWRFQEKTNKQKTNQHQRFFFIISHPNKIFISRNKSLKKREKNVSIAFL